MRSTQRLRGFAPLALLAATMLVAPLASADPLKVLKRKQNFDGTTQLTVATEMPQWDTKFGVDLGMGAAPTLPAPNAPQDQSGSAWASVTVPRLPSALPFERASLEARVDAFREEAKVGTSLSRSIPLGRNLALTMQNGYWLTQNGYAVAHPETEATQTWTTDQVVKLRVLPTDTTIAAGAALHSADGQWLRSLTANQKIYGGLSVSSGVSEAADGSFAKRISAGFRRSW